MFLPNFSCGPCIYCNLKSEDKPEEFLKCEVCKGSSHIICLKSGPPPNRLLGDNFFIFTCSQCSPNNVEIVQRVNISILHGMLIAMYNLYLTAEHEAEEGYYHYKKHIHSYMMSKWKELFDFDGKKISSKDKTRLQPSCVSGILRQSVYFNPKKTGRGGWYRLVEVKSPALLIQLFSEKKHPNISESDLAIKDESKKLKHNEQHSFLPGSNYSLNIKKEAPDVSPVESLVDDNSSRGSWFLDKDIIKPGQQLPSSIFAYEDEVDVELKDEFSDSMNWQDSSSGKNSNENLPMVVRPSLFHKLEPKKQYIEEESRTEELVNIIQISAFEENNLLNQLEKLNSASTLPSKLYRLRRKLKTRRLKREHGLPLFEIDSELNFFKKNGRLMLPKERKSQQLAFEHNNIYIKETPRVLDRFQIPDHFTVTKKEFTSFKFKLVGEGVDNFEFVYSPYTLRQLKPYIFRDYDVIPQKLKLLQELIAYPHRHNHDWKPPPRYPIDYCYVTRKHIPSMNQLARQFFWPGIELSEVLQYPDFTCVVLYAKLVIGFGILVPDVSHNEAYISFLLVHPEWRRVGIAKFILYHLIQTCPGKDITLHVSATNPALIIYQQFGFKVEEFLTDFYYKYFEEDSLECKHAMFLRLSR